MITGLTAQRIAPNSLKSEKKLVFFSIIFFLLRIELLTLRGGYRKPTLARLLSLISALYDKRFARYAKKFENRASKTAVGLHHIFMTSQRAKILCVEFLSKTPPIETPGFLKFKNGEIIKYPRVDGQP